MAHEITITAVVGKNYYDVTTNFGSGFKMWSDNIISIDNTTNPLNSNPYVNLNYNGEYYELTLTGADDTYKVMSILTVTPADLGALATALADLKG